MFRTLRSKLIFSYVAISLLMLVLVFAVTLLLARDTAHQNGFDNLRQKKAVALPYIYLVLLDQRRAGARPALGANAVDNVKRAGLRLLLVDPDTLKIEIDTAAGATTVGHVFPFARDLDTGALLTSGQTVAGTSTLPGEKKVYQYLAQRSPGGRLSSQTSGSAPGSDQQTASRQIVIVAQVEPNFTDLVQLARDLFLPAVLVALAVSVLVAFLLARSLSRPLAQLAGAAEALAGGDYTYRLPVRGHDEMATLTGQFNVMAQEVGQAHMMQRDFVANVSHDLKTPLTSIQGFSQAMLDGSIKDEAQYRQAASIINSEAARMSRLVSQLLSLSQLQSGLRSIDMRPTELGPLLSQLVLTMQPQAQAAQVDLIARFNLPSMLVMADADKLKQAFSNLIDNALKHTPAGGHVTVELTQGAGSVEIAVCDTGSGIPAGDLPRVVERFYQVDKARGPSEGKSLGLGLAIAREIIAAHHGRIALESQEGSGTMVRVTLPSGAAESTQPAKSTSLLRRTPAGNSHAAFTPAKGAKNGQTLLPTETHSAPSTGSASDPQAAGHR